MIKELVCIVCPKSCHLRVDTENGFSVTGNLCPRGAAYGRSEVENPVRVVTSTVMIQGAEHRRCPVKTNGAIPKHLVFDVIRALDGIMLYAPVDLGQLVVKNICGTKISVITTRSMRRIQH